MKRIKSLVAKALIGLIALSVLGLVVMSAGVALVIGVAFALAVRLAGPDLSAAFEKKARREQHHAEATPEAV